MRSIKHTAIAVALTAVLASCSEDTQAGPDNQPTDPTEATGCQSPVSSGDEGLSPGCWTIDFPGGPRAELDLPTGFYGSDWGVWMDPPKPENWGNIALRATGDVWRDPCKREETPPALGPTVEDFTRALVAQKVTRSTAPVPVEVDGHTGLYVEVSVPAGADLTGCRDAQLVLWEGPADEVPQMTHEFMKRYWVLDVDGQRVVVAVTTHPNVTKNAVARFSGIVDSATFSEG